MKRFKRIALRAMVYILAFFGLIISAVFGVVQFKLVFGEYATPAFVTVVIICALIWAAWAIDEDSQ